MSYSCKLATEIKPYYCPLIKSSNVKNFISEVNELEPFSLSTEHEIFDFLEIEDVIDYSHFQETGDLLFTNGFAPYGEDIFNVLVKYCEDHTLIYKTQDDDVYRLTYKDGKIIRERGELNFSPVGKKTFYTIILVEREPVSNSDDGLFRTYLSDDKLLLFDTKEEAFEYAMIMAESEVEKLNSGCLEEVSFGIPEDDEWQNSNCVVVNYYYNDNTEMVSKYIIKEATLNE